ncbi:MAG: InlB B-repeat-containing protein, partial [Peptoniphilaceae bacterium]
MKNKRERIHDWLRRSLALLLALVMVVTMLPLNVFADDFLYDHMDKEKSGFINELPVEPAKPEEGKAATDLIKNPDMPEIYTLRTDYKVRKNQDWKINYQPYVASVGENATPEERAQVNKTINVPDLKGYDKPLKTKFDVTYDGVVNEAKKGSNQGVYWQKNKDFRYEPKDSVVKVKHVFQSLTDFNEYGLRDGETEDKYTESIGKTGNLLEVQALKGDAIRGFEAEADVLSTMVPEDTTDFEVEYRYNRKSYDVDYNTEGGTDVASRLLYYGQKIPGAEEPKKNGSIFLGWKPSCDLKGVVDNTEKTFKKNEIITNGAGNPIKDLKANLVMPAEDVVFTAVWKDAPKADYLIQFWTEKPDYDDKDDTLPLRDRYDYIGSKRVEKVDTGLRPDLTDLDIHGITFPDLNDERLEKAQNNKEEFERYYFLNKDLTQKQNASKEDPNVQKSVLSTGETVYNVYYNRRVYTLYFTAANELAFDNAGSFWPIITRDGQIIGQEGSPYKAEVRFNQSLNKIWPKDEEVSNLPPGSSDPEGDIGLIGWTINNNEGEQAYRDTPPYRLSAEDFIDSQDVVGTGEFEGFGHSDQIPIKDGETKKRDKYEISLGSTSYERSVVHHIDIIKDDFDGKEQIDYDKSYWKSDTSTVEYGFGLPHLQGFTLKEETRPAEWIGQKEGSVGNWDAYKTFDELNAERNKKTPFRSDADKIEYIDKFPWGTKSFNGVNAYNYANYTRNKYKLKLNNDPKNIKNDNEYTDGKDRIEVFYEMPLKDLNLEEKYVPEKPAWVPENWVFKGWALDPAGENMVKGGNETKLHYDQFLFAKWGEPDHSWKVTVDPNGGEMKDLTVDDIIDRRVTVNRGDEVKDVAKKELDDGDKQIFTVKHRQRLQAPPRPERKGYNFLGWELVRQNKDGSEDTSFRRDYHVPELYAFSNDLVSHVYLRAIWVKNDRVDVPVHHHFIDSEGNEIKPPRDPFIIEDARVGYYTAATATEQDAEWILMPHEELEALADDNPVKQQYMAYNALRKFNNADFHSLRVEALKVLHEGKEVDNPKAQNNVFHFYYRRFRTRNYKVNYLDERAKAELANATTEDAKKKIIKNYRIIPQENVVSKNRHFDARNYRPIPGWKLASDAQQQLFYDINETTGEFFGINGTGKDEITFYYK